MWRTGLLGGLNRSNVTKRPTPATLIYLGVGRLREVEARIEVGPERWHERGSPGLVAGEEGADSHRAASFVPAADADADLGAERCG
jgi:hypothetical protein